MRPQEKDLDSSAVTIAAGDEVAVLGWVNVDRDLLADRLGIPGATLTRTVSATTRVILVGEQHRRAAAASADELDLERQLKAVLDTEAKPDLAAGGPADADSMRSTLNHLHLDWTALDDGYSVVERHGRGVWRSPRRYDVYSERGGSMTLPADGHVHTEWSYDARRGSMEGSCARAVELGLPAIAFTEHVDHTVWTVPMEFIDPTDLVVSPTGVVTPPSFDSAGYFDAIDRCRHLFPALRILTGIEVGEPHWHATAVATVIASGPFDRVLGSQHCLPDGDGFAEPSGLYRHRDAAQVMRLYLAEVARLVAGCDAFSVLAHIDYPVRSWPAGNGRFAPHDFEDEFRSVLRVLADSGRALEVNTRVPLCSEVVQWWREEGGSAVTFGSDAHDPLTVAAGFRLAAAMVEAHGFRPADHPYGLWTRAG